MDWWLINFYDTGIVIAHIAGILHAGHAFMKVRTPQGTIAWILALVLLPLLAIPLYWIFGRNRFIGYEQAQREGRLPLDLAVEEACRALKPFASPLVEDISYKYVNDRLFRLPVTRGNDIQLLVDGDATFAAIFEAIREAKEYILVQFFIVHDDQIGREFQNALLEKAKSGVAIYFLYDEIGSNKLPRSYREKLRGAGIRMSAFRTTRGKGNRFQINFRNHRKLVLVDGRIALTGGHNVGDEYLGRSAKFGHWRDTHVRVEGPAVQALQVAFLEDWNWATGDVLKLNWQPTRHSADRSLGVLPTGPADHFDSCTLALLHGINGAERRLWMASPYFVLDSAVLFAVELAALRGVDVRVMLPAKADHLLPFLTSYSYYDGLRPTGVKIFRYQDGFLHQKVLLVDDSLAVVGSINLDYRSFRLNFEMGIAAFDEEFAGQVEKMLEADFSKCQEEDLTIYRRRSRWFRAKVRFARLMAPIQ